MISADSKVGAAGPQSGSYVAVDTWANLVATYSSASYDGCIFVASDVGVAGGIFKNIGGVLCKDNEIFIHDRAKTGTLVLGGTGWTVTQSGFTVTATKTSHGIPSDLAGCIVHATGAGSFVTEYCTNMVYVDADTIQFTSATSRTIASPEALGTNTSKTYGYNTFTAPSWRQLGVYVQYQFELRSSAVTGNKTYVMEYGGVQVVTAAVQSTTATYTGLGTNIEWMSSSTFIVLANTGATGNGLLITESNTVCSCAVTLANAGEWGYMKPAFSQFFWRK